MVAKKDKKEENNIVSNLRLHWLDESVFVLFLFVNYFCRKPKKSKKKKKIMIKRIKMRVLVKKIKIQANVRKEKNR